MRSQISKYLVIGNGFLGSSLSSNLLAPILPSHIHEGLKRPQALGAPDVDTLKTFLESINYSVFINASGSSSIQASVLNPQHFLSDPVIQIKAHIEILEQLKNPPIYLYISSAAVYGETSKLGASEIKQCNPISPYGQGRLDAEKTLRLLAKTYPGRVMILRVFSAYSNDLRKQIPYLISEKYAQRTRIELFGTGDETRDFVHTSDISSAIELIVSNCKKEYFSIFNVGTGNATSIFELTQIANQVLGELGKAPVNVYFNQIPKAGDPKNLVADIFKLESLGFRIATSPKVGMLNFFRSVLK